MRSEKKRKVLFIMQLPPPVHGVSVMSKIIKESKLLNEQFQCDYINLATSSQISDLQKSSPAKFLRTFKIIFEVLAKLMFKRYDKVYITIFPFGFSFFKDAGVVFICKLFNYKPLLHLHTYGFKKAARTSAWRFKLYKYVFKKVQVICLSERLIEDVEEIYHGEVLVLPNGIPQVNFVNTYSLKTEPIQLLYLSNLVTGKGILILLDALSLIKNAGLQFHLRIAGAENDITYPMLQTILNEKGLSSQVTLVGPKFGVDKYLELKNADIFILPTNYDTFGLVLLEAMQFGLPCISTSVGAIPEVLADGRGLVLKSITPAELCNTIVYLIENPALRLNMSVKSFEYFKMHFTSAVFEKNLAAILNNQPFNVDHRLVTKKV
ncbi:glycosyl transferase family 1 [Sphingobacteriaceae bacterium]|nr:glycosyl transferase family 1 [Sphingobacteriaceae bacterium]